MTTEVFTIVIHARDLVVAALVLGWAIGVLCALEAVRRLLSRRGPR